ncbi:thiamine-monophosphate kinase [Rhodanobacter sp. Root480]|uniref:thiamine-phosphate kinase n=1 Tax=Rhodanobacter sp. Root480 TaxID=1736542 RepID=UPI0006F4F2A5|nr:thiamine-phosphate kinase [Rhodanobacter sp. Root480]KQX97123.1 thiamine-monophosphate kinase [Rhodanobacter sp. Root480]
MEFRLIDRIRELTAQPRDDVRLGIGDDAAVLAVPAGQELVVAIDTMVEGTHFLPGTAPADLGWKALAVNLSDLAAMGATPAWALLALTLPKADAAFVDGFAEGFAQLAQPHRLALVGGDTTGGPLCISVAVHGFVPPGQALTRAGAQVGDEVLVTGTLGDALAGLYALREPPHDNVHQATLRQSLIERLTRPEPRVAAGIALRGLASACVDISDGLLADLGHICSASGVGAELEAAQLPRSPALRELHGEDESIQLALSGGDNYELCFTVPPQRLAAALAALAETGCPVTRIGRIVEGHDVRVRAVDGSPLTVTMKGWEHFA